MQDFAGKRGKVALGGSDPTLNGEKKPNLPEHQEKGTGQGKKVVGAGGVGGGGLGWGGGVGGGGG